ncbi:MAG: hypothetical protein P8N51_11880 [Pseudomonadales bacterium]|jgi:hypothetical protein|nr:hypothetical protein [Pseudomonadales bacterium]MDG1442980.1 hypothetical protein [Pseudomonadales bacterium]
MSENIESIDQRLNLTIRARLKIDNQPNWVHGVGLGGSLAVLGLFVILYLVFKDVPVWNNWRPAAEFINPEYGERIYADSVFRTRMNTWSNLSYILFGFYAIALGINDWKKGLSLERGYLAHVPIQSVLFGIALIYSGLASGFFHASLTHYGQQCDVGAMYAMMLCIAAIPVGSWLPQAQVPGTHRNYPTWPVIAVLVVSGSLYFTYYKWDYNFGDVSSYSTSVLFIFAAASLIQPGKYLQLRWLIAAFVSIAVAAKIRELDMQDGFTGPDSVFQGHAVWHLISSLYYFFIFLYFRSEERK